MDFGQALDALKTGSKVTREGWNGKGMFVVHQKGYPDGVPLNRNTAEATGLAEGTVCAFRPYLMMRTVDGDFVPWVASQTDLLAEDWLQAGGPVRTVVHIAGPDIQVGPRLRQRCGWCGTLLLDYSLDRIAVPEGQDPRPATWPVGDLIAVDGGLSHVVPHQDGDQLPAEACAVLDDVATR